MTISLCLSNLQIIEVLLLLFIPIILSLVEYLWSDLFLDRAAQRILEYSEGGERYFYGIITSVPHIRGLSLCFVGVALDIELLLNHQEVASVFAALSQLLDPIPLLIALLVAKLPLVLWAIYKGQDTYMRDVHETVKILKGHPAQDSAMDALNDSNVLAQGRRRRQTIVFVGALTIAIPLFTFFLLLRC